MIKCSTYFLSSWGNDTRLFVHKRLWGILLLICIQFLKVNSTWRRVRYNRARLPFHKLTEQSKHLSFLLTSFHPLLQLVTSWCKCPCGINAWTSSKLHRCSHADFSHNTANYNSKKKLKQKDFRWAYILLMFPKWRPKIQSKKILQLFSSATHLTVVPLWSTLLGRKKNNTSCQIRGGIKSEIERSQNNCAKMDFPNIFIWNTIGAYSFLVHTDKVF